MGRVLERLAIFNLLLAVQASPVTKSQPESGVTVRMYDYASVSRNGMAQAERVTTRLLGEAGIAIKIFRCSSDGGQPALAPCLEPLGTAELVVRILPGADPVRRHRQSGVSDVPYLIRRLLRVPYINRREEVGR
jgi:hypothetical protein